MRGPFVWWIFTDAPNEAERRGIGRDDMERTIDHLRQRGDEKIIVHMEEAGATMIEEITLNGAAGLGILPPDWGA